MLKSFNDNIEFSPSSRLARGFTLLELLVVVALLALLASVALVAMDRTGTEARDDLTRIEMNEIRKALRMFYRDVGHFPAANEATPNNLSDVAVGFLSLCQGNDAGVPATYDDGCITWDPDTKRGWNGPYLGREEGDEANSLNEFAGQIDPWRRHYRLIDPHDPDNTRLVSFGANGNDETASLPATCPEANHMPEAGNDDIILCLLK